jgi:hypothetical protein
MSNDVSRRDFVRTAGVSTASVALAGLTAGRSAAAPPGQAPGRTQAFIREVRQARLFDLSFTWDETSPIASVNPHFSMFLNRTHDAFDPADPDFSDDHTRGTRGMFGDGGQLSFASEVMHWSGQHGAPSIDALGHIGHNGLLFGGVNAAAATSDLRGIGRSGVGANLGIDQYATDRLVNRGVLLDVARFLRGDDQPLPGTVEITANNLMDTAAAQRVSLAPGDTILIRTGWGQHFTGNPILYTGNDSPGPGLDGAHF